MTANAPPTTTLAQLSETLRHFVLNECQSAEMEYETHMASRNGDDRWTQDAVPPCISRLQRRSQQLGLWNLFLGTESSQQTLKSLPWFQPLALQYSFILPPFVISNADYAALCEIMGHSFLAPEACNCSAPDKIGRAHV